MALEMPVLRYWYFTGLSIKTQIREQMSGLDLYVFTLKFLALKKLFFSLVWGKNFFVVVV